MAMVAAISLSLINPFRTGKLVLFQVTFNRDWYAFELPVFVLLGVLGGLYGAFFIKLNLRLAAFRRNSFVKQFPIYETVAVALATTLLSYPFEFLRSNTGDLVANLFRECSEVEQDFHGLCRDDMFTSVILSLLFTAFNS